MARFKLHLTILSLFILALIFAGRLPAHSDSSKQPAPRPVFDTTYRSRAGMHKVIVQANDATLRDAILAAGGAVVEDYGSFALMSAPEAAAESVSTQSLDGSAVRDDMNALMLRAHSFDTTVGDEAYSASSLGALEPADEQLYLVQMVGPVKKDWVRQIAGEAEIVAYVPNNGYLVRATADAFARLKQMQSDDRPFVQFAGSYKPEYPWRLDGPVSEESWRSCREPTPKRGSTPSAGCGGSHRPCGRCVPAAFPNAQSPEDKGFQSSYACSCPALL